MTAGPREIPEGEEILRRFEPLVRATARRYAGRGADFDDLVQEGFLALWLALPRCRVPEALPLFLKQSVDRAVRHGAARLRRPDSWVQEAEEEEGDEGREFPSDRTREELEAWMVLDALEEEDRVLVTVLAAGGTQAEAGRALGLSRATVGFRLGRVRRRWGALFGDSGLRGGEKGWGHVA